MKPEVRLGDSKDVDGAAQVWARATARRDDKPVIPPLQAARDVLLDSLRKERSTFVVAASGGDVLGFAIAEPTTSPRVAEVRYVGVDPAYWRASVGTAVMARMADELVSAGFRTAQLLVYADNLPARRLYERMGWQWDEAPPSTHPRTGKGEVRYCLRLGNDHRPRN
ncbi:MAG TPA: GNAT family N-acetyltransferase [Gaiellaceae bacterium]|nr:GNAT family N-acetyltransferase [Gaiellaceae bacterium]